MTDQSQASPEAPPQLAPDADAFIVTPTEPEPHLPAPTVWPAIAASGIALLLWGFVASLVVTAAGAALFIIAAVGWAQKILAEAGDHSAKEG